MKVEENVLTIYETVWDNQRAVLTLLGFNPDCAPPDGKPVNIVVAGGQAGGGKSRLLRMHAAAVALAWPGSTYGMFRRTDDDLRANHIEPFQQEVPSRLATYNKTENQLRWYNGSLTKFHQLATDKSHEQYIGHEFDAIGIDESTAVTEEAILYLWARCRSSRGVGEWWPSMLLPTNPIGVSHLWHKRTFVDAAPERTVFTIGPFAPSRQTYRACYWPMPLEGNPALDYEDTMAKNLMIPDEQVRNALAYGSWDLTYGQFFSEFDRRRHVVDDFEIPAHWPKWTGHDYGDSALQVCLWLARNPDVPWPETYVYRELCRTRTPAQVFARGIVGLSIQDGTVQGRQLRGQHYAGRDFFDRTRNRGAGVTLADEYARAGVHLTRANDARVAGWARIKRALYWAEGHPVPPELRVFRSCQETIRELSLTMRSQKAGRYEDIEQPTNNTHALRDDCLEALRHAFQGAAAAARRRSAPRRRWAVA